MTDPYRCTNDCQPWHTALAAGDIADQIDKMRERVGPAPDAMQIFADTPNDRQGVLFHEVYAALAQTLAEVLPEEQRTEAQQRLLHVAGWQLLMLQHTHHRLHPTSCKTLRRRERFAKQMIFGLIRAHEKLKKQGVYA